MNRALLLACAAGCSSSPTTIANAVPVPPAGLRAKALLDRRPPDGTEVTVDLYEPLYDSGSTSGADDGEFEVEVPDVGSKRFVLAPGTLAPLPAHLFAPIRVRGTIGAHRVRPSDSLSLHASSIEPLPPPPVTRVSTHAIAADPERFSGAFVEVEGSYVVGMEASVLDGELWVNFYPDALVRCEPARAAAKYNQPPRRVRVTGFTYTAGNYGFMGKSAFEIVATRLVYLDPTRADCR